MANFIQNLGLDFMTETEETVTMLLNAIAQEGKFITGYYGFPYINQRYGDVHFILRTQRNEAEKKIEITGMDTHCTGDCIWEKRILFPELPPVVSEITERRVVLANKDGGDLIIVNIVNADVLPGYLENDTIKLQMIAFPVSIGYFSNEDEYADTLKAEKDGSKWLIDDGSIIPAVFLFNHNPNIKEEEKDYDLDDRVMMRGKVKGIYHGVFRIGEKRQHTFIRCLIETHHGDIEIAHTIDQVPEQQRKNLKIGAIVTGEFVLSGDAAVCGYENGYIKDTEHNFHLLRAVLEKGEAIRLRCLLTEDAELISESDHLKFYGQKEILSYLEKISETKKDKLFTQMATVLSDKSESQSFLYDDKTRTRCIMLSCDDKKRFESVVFMDINEDGLIHKIKITPITGYQLKTD